MIAHVEEVESMIPGLFNVWADDGRCWLDLTVNQVRYVARKERLALVPPSPTHPFAASLN